MLPKAPLGERGDRPVLFWTNKTKVELAHVLAIPGVGWLPGVVTCAWDVAPRVGELLGYQVPTPPPGADAPGMAEYDALGFRQVMRQYQKTAALFLLRCAWALLALPQRTGKSIVALAAAVAIGAKRVLVVSPGGAKYTWVDEIAKWTKTAAIYLDGRGGREARRFCLTCMGSGRTADDSDWCPACRQLNGQSYGYEIIEVRNVSRPVHPEPIVPEPRVAKREGPPRASGALKIGVRLNLLRTPPMGPRYPTKREIRALKSDLAQRYPPLYRCSVHEDVTAADPRLFCVKCREAMLRALRAARFIVIAYDLMPGQDHYSEEGAFLGERLDLPGWAPIIGRLEFDLAILDEVRVLRRGARVDKKRRGKNRRDRTARAVKKIQRVWGLDGTPVGGFTRDLYGPLDIISNGLFGTPHYSFDERYCEGHTSEHGGWEADGRSILAETELVPRLKSCMHKRERSEIVPELPPKQWQDIRLDPITPITHEPIAIGDRDSMHGKKIASSLASKIETVVDNVVEGLLEGTSHFVLCFHPSSADTVCAAIEAEIRKPHNASRLAALNPQVWLTTGKNPKARVDMCKAFVKHVENKGAGVLVSTHGQMGQGGLSLRGAAAVHVVELDWNPDRLAQAIDRPNEVGITQGLVVCVYSVKGTYDEHVLSALGPKFRTQVLLTGDEGARDAERALIGERESSEEIWRRLTAHLSSVKDDG